MQAEHHLVQEQLDERPDIPGLTPRGFERWMRLMIIAHPEKEYQRLQRTVLEMPISNPDEPKERFPKELPRRLFPKAPDSNVKEQLERCILAHCHVELSDNAPEKDHLQANTQRPRVSSSIAPSSHNADPRLNSPFEEDEEEDEEDDDEDDDEPALLTHPIERERKPYAVQPGSGRVYDDNLKPINSPAEQAKYREFSGRNGRHSPAASGGGHSASGHKHQHQHHPSQDFAGRDAEFIKPPMSARFHGGEEGETRYREHTRDRDRHSDDRVPHAHTHAHEHVRDRGEPDGGAIPTPTAGNVRSGWDTDEEEYYRAPSAMSGRNGRHTPGTYDNGNQWPFR